MPEKTKHVLGLVALAVPPVGWVYAVTVCVRTPHCTPDVRQVHLRHRPALY